MMSFFRPMNGIQWLTLLLIPIMAAGFIYGFAKLHNVQTHQNDTLSAIMCHGEQLIRVAKDITPIQRAQTLHFYERQIRIEHLRACTRT